MLTVVKNHIKFRSNILFSTLPDYRQSWEFKSWSMLGIHKYHAILFSNVSTAAAYYSHSQCLSLILTRLFILSRRYGRDGQIDYPSKLKDFIPVLDNSFIMFLAILLTVILVCVGYKWYRHHEIQQKLLWVPGIPGWPLLGNILEFGKTTDTLRALTSLMDRYGKLMLVNFVFNSVIITADYEFIEFVLGTQKVLNKSQAYTFLHKWLGSGLLTSGGTKWKRMRKLITPAFHFSILEQFIDTFESNGKILVNKLEKLITKDAIDVYQLVTLYALDVICETAMGVSVNAQKDEKSEYVVSVKEMCRIVAERWISVFKRSELLYPLFQDFYIQKKALSVLHSFTYSVIDSKVERLKGSEKMKISTTNDKDDVGLKKKLAFLDILLRSSENLTREEIREEVDTFMFEGHDTTSSAISFALYLLARHQNVQEQALEEQKHIFGDDRDRKTTYQDLQDMKYLECVIKETLRLYPSVPSYSRGVHEDVVYKGNTIPKGTNINIFAYGMLRDPQNYKDPQKFDPTRFEEIDGKRPYVYIPFSAGPRNCIGQKFALMEVKSVISKILRHFHLLPTEPEHKLELILEVILKSRTGVKIRLAKRDW